MTDFLDIFILVFKVYCYVAISLLPVVLYNSLCNSKFKPNSDFYPQKEWYHFMKVWWAKTAVHKYKKKFSTAIKQENVESIEQPRKLTTFMRSDSQTIYGADQTGNSLFIRLCLRENRLAELSLQIRLSDGRIYQLPEHPLILLCSIPNRKWEAGGLHLNIVEPFSTLRVTFNGCLRNVIRNDELTERGDIEHVYFSFIWTAACGAKYFPQDSCSDVLARAVSVEPWRDANWINLLGSQTGYDQYGMLLGQIKVANSNAPLVLRMSSSRKRMWGPSEPRITHRSLTLFATDAHGLVMNITVKSYMKGCRELHIGSVILPDRRVHAIEACDISLPDFFENRIIPGAFTFSFKAGGKQYDCRAFTYCNTIADMRNEEVKGYKSKLIKIKYRINKEEATGFGIFWYQYQGRGVRLPPYIIRPGKQIVESERKYVAPLTNVECRSVYLAGIKGTSLALLSAINSSKFLVADGFCILTTALADHLNQYQALKDELSKLNDICCELIDGDLSDACDRVQRLFKKTPLSEELCELVLQDLHLMKFKHTSIESENVVRLSWAVRTSCVDEDLEKVAALRNQTFLDCTSDEEVLKAIVECWASVYSTVRVQYRRKRGLPIICDMALVVQQVITADTAGELSTNHPKTSDPTTMILSANYGLGVSVVTAMIAPDTAVINRTWDGKLSVHGKTTGTKAHKVVITRTGLNKVENSPIDRNNFCLNETQIYQLSEVGLGVEKALGGPKIIEWAFVQDQLYLLNAKSMDLQYDWTQFDLTHEMDSAVMSEKECTVFNSTDNVFAGVHCVLTQSLCVKFLDESLQKNYKSAFGGPVLQILTLNSHNLGCNLFETILKYVSNDITEELKIHELVTTGRSVTTKSLLKDAIYRNGVTKMSTTLVNLMHRIFTCWTGEDYANEARVLSQTMRMISSSQSSAMIHYRVIKRNLQLLKRIIHLHSCIVFNNMFYVKLLMNLLYDETTELTAEYYNDVLNIFADNTLYELPLKLELASAMIRNNELVEEFSTVAASDGISWLEERCPESFLLLDKFMDTFGHRAVQETDLISQSWQTNSKVLIRILQKILEKLEADKTEDTSQKEVFDRQCTIKHKLQGRIFEWLKQRIQNAIAQKETTSSALALTMNKFRQAFRELAKKLVHEGKLPDTALIFHLTQAEIEKILVNNSPHLVGKAIQRQSLFTTWKRQRFPEFWTAATALNGTKTTASSAGSVRILGTGLNPGYAIGRACIIDDIQKVNFIRPGDILIIPALDVGWCPYFPILNGVICESNNLSTEGADVCFVNLYFTPIKMEYWLVISTIFLYCSVLVSGQHRRDCSRSEYNRCINLADPLLKEPHLVFPDNMADIELVCLTWNQFVDCLKGYTDHCFTDQQRRQFNKAVENPIESVHQMCTQRSYQQEYLQHATCIKSTVTQPQHCGDQYTQLVNQVSQGEAISRASLCCSHDRFRRCVAREVRRMCDRGVPNGRAVKFAEQIIDKALSFLQDQCLNYIPNSGDCVTISYKSSDDQLAISTSPWYSTRTGSTQGDLDTMSTGVTVLDMSSPSDTSGAPSFQAIDTKVTDISWLPSLPDTDGTSTMYKETSGSTVGGTTKEETSSTGLLGSRTRPSSYGRSSSWDTSPVSSPSPTPPTRPDWATVSTWHVYSAGDRTGNSQSTFGSPSTSGDRNSDRTLDTTFMDRRTTTETWYPAAGSHVGNEVDEPNQLGLSKPQHNGAMPQKVVAVELSLTVVATVLVAYC
ncbi:uncharacterized protein CBL_02189 [Carabus blaptoides fortunei]